LKSPPKSGDPGIKKDPKMLTFFIFDKMKVWDLVVLRRVPFLAYKRPE
jgi:hypothetical protein